MSMFKPWNPPPFGSPVFIEIPTLDVTKSEKFYSAVFNWPIWAENPKEHPKEDVAMFDFQDPRISGGLIKTMPDANSGQVKQGDRGSACIWYRVEKVEASSETIEKEGGQLVSQIFDDGKHGRFRYFKDPDGNVAVIYQYIGEILTQ
ncbi:unnamed protein product [Clonostachys rosea]|uniref:VOC domain-containing protein n=1 Tax=Bionectria ochroleuca TaxID=29856 RepID=A0ABY6TZQ1_BIOOC|nr:unnamed protein product [Clonostachys rosea]